MSYRFCSLIDYIPEFSSRAPGGKNHVICFFVSDHLSCCLAREALSDSYFHTISCLLHAHEKSNQYLPWKFHTPHSILNQYRVDQKFWISIFFWSVRIIFAHDNFGTKTLDWLFFSYPELVLILSHLTFLYATKKLIK